MDKNGNIIGFIEKPIERSYKLASTACYLLQRDTIEKVISYLDDQYDDSLGEFIGWLINQTEIVGYQFQEEWYDIGTREGILSANAYLMAHFASKQNEPELTQGKTEIIPPVHIEKHVTISNATIGPNVFIGRGSKITNSRIENSIIYENAKVQNCYLRNSIVGADSITEGNISEAVFGPHTMLIRDITSEK